MLEIKAVSSIHAIQPAVWDQLSAGRPFQSHQWYAFGERVMADCPATYLLVFDDDKLIGRACFWLVRNEPLPPTLPRSLRFLISAFLKRWPLFVCRSPMANMSGLTLPNDAQRDSIILELARAALTTARQYHASIVVFDFLKETDLRGWPPGFSRTKLPSPGTVMENHWKSMEEYLAHGNKKDRQHYKRSLREAQKLGIELKRHQRVSDVDAAVELIRVVEQRHTSSPNPWIPALLENIEMVDGTWLEAYRGTKLVGCGLIFEDNGAQMTTALGLAENEPYAYFLLIYASLESAFEKRVRLLRWGTGAYDVKQRLGFKPELDNFLTFAGTSRFTNLVSQLIA